MKFNIEYIFRVIIIAIFLLIAVFFYLQSPEKIVSYIGVKNSYILMFALAFIGGLTTFSGVPYYLFLILFAISGLNPLLLGVLSASGVMLGDATSYFIGYSGNAIVPSKIQQKLQKFCDFCLKYSRVLPVAFFLYGCFVPLSNDFIVISMGLARYPFWRVMIPLGLGNLVFNISLAYLAQYFL